MINVEEIRQDFPILKSPHPSGKPLIYLDNAATTQKPNSVLNCLQKFYTTTNANIHRGLYDLAIKATDAYEKSRETVARYIHASPNEVIFTKSCTESINLISATWGEKNVQAGDNIIVSGMEHHSNFVPWQQLCERKKAHLRVIPITTQGELDMEAYANMLDGKTKLVAVVHVSNAIGTINPVNHIIQEAHWKGAKVLLDGAQSMTSVDIDLLKLGCDFFAFSGHKVFGPSGIGVLFGKHELLMDMEPYQYGGEMIQSVSTGRSVFKKPPHRFEAGTPPVAQAVALAQALDFVSEIGLMNIVKHQQGLLSYASEGLKNIEGLRIIGEAKNRAAIISFHFDDIHPHDVATILDQNGIAVRAGHHCTEPLMRYFAIPGTTRVSFSVYNTKTEINVLIAGLERVKSIFV